VACGSSAGGIHIISLARSRELSRLKVVGDASMAEVLDVKSHMNSKQLLVSLSVGYMCIWNLESGMLVFKIDVNARCIAIRNCGTRLTRLVAGDLEGNIMLFSITSDGTLMDTHTTIKGLHSASIDDLVCLSDDEMLSKSTEGVMKHWKNDGKVVRKWNVGRNVSRIGTTSDGQYFCIGDIQGTARIYSIFGNEIFPISHQKCQKIIRGCIFTTDSKQLIIYGDDGVMWRFDYIPASFLTLAGAS
jgi:WD40 repeat protein